METGNYKRVIQPVFIYSGRGVKPKFLTLIKASTIVAAAALLLISATAHGSYIILYGDEDGFGIGATTYKDPTVDSAMPGEAEGTDVRLIGTGFNAPPFAPTANLTFAPQPSITSILMTMSMAEFGGNLAPADDGPNAIMLDGVPVYAEFLNSFASFAIGANPNIDTHSYLLPAKFFPLFEDGSVSLTGTHFAEREGYGSFQVDYIRSIFL